MYKMCLDSNAEQRHYHKSHTAELYQQQLQ
jgi:hypothetical protein